VDVLLALSPCIGQNFLVLNHAVKTVNPSHPGSGFRLAGIYLDTRMTAEHILSLQDAFLHHLRENKIPVLMFLANGVRLQGYIRSFDKFSIQLARGNSSQVVFKHAISAINPEDDIQLTGPTGES
jgi:host factor-I protein